MSILGNFIVSALVVSIIFTSSNSILQYYRTLRSINYESQISEIIRIARMLAITKNKSINICSSIDGVSCSVQRDYKFLIIIDQKQIIYKRFPIEGRLIIYRGFGNQQGGVFIKVSSWIQTYNHGTFYLGDKNFICVTVNKAAKTYKHFCY